jgi:hypothetical protein
MIPQPHRFLLLVPCLAAAAFAQSSFVVPAAQANSLGNTNGGFPFSYTQYVRYQQAIGTSHFSGPVPVFGLALRSTTQVIMVPEVQRQSMIVELADCTVAPSALDGTYGNNVGSNMTRVFNGTLNILKPNRADALEFGTLIPFERFYVHTNQRPMLIDLQPTGFDNLPCGSGGNGTSFDGIMNDPDIWSVLGKGNPCATPTTGGQRLNSGFVFRFLIGNQLMPYGKACQGSTGLMPRIGSAGTPSVPSPTFQVTLGQAAPSVRAAGFILGGAEQALELSAIGFPQCWLNASLDLAIGLPVGGGNAIAPLPIPNDPSLIGRSVFSQWALADVTAVTTQGGRITPR